MSKLLCKDSPRWCIFMPPLLFPDFVLLFHTTYTSMQSVSFKAAILFFFSFFNDTSLRGKFLMPQIENRPVFFQEFVLLKKFPSSRITADHREGKSHAWVTTEDKLKRACWCLKKNEEINRKRQDGKWIYNIWWCCLKGFIALSEWQIFNRITSSEEQTSFQNNLASVFAQFWDALWNTTYQVSFQDWIVEDWMIIVILTAALMNGTAWAPSPVSVSDPSLRRTFQLLVFVILLLQSCDHSWVIKFEDCPVAQFLQNSIPDGER